MLSTGLMLARKYDVHGLRGRYQRVLGGARGAIVRGRKKQRAGDDTGYVQLAMTAKRGGKHDESPRKRQ
jgi:hypothetical protein